MNRILVLGIGTLLFFGIGGFFLIEHVQANNFSSVLLSGWTIPLQLLTGTAYGLLSAGIALFIITRNFFKEERNFYHSIFSKWNLTFPKIIFVSFCAGIGEEIFFRGGIQPLIGIWWTALIFVALHGYLNPFNWKISVYGTTMLVLMAGIGYLFDYAGLISAMTAHAFFDIVLFIFMIKSKK